MISRTLGTDLPWETTPCSRDEVVVDNGFGPLATAPLGRVLAQRQAYIDRVASVFGAETGWDRVLELGPNRDLIGRPVKEVWRLEDGSGATTVPDRSGAALDVFRPGAASNKVLRQRGTIEGAGGPAALAISVNGRIAAVGRSFEEGDEIRYTILLPERALRPGRNRIELFEAEGGGEAPSLTRLGSSSDQ